MENSTFIPTTIQALTSRAPRRGRKDAKLLFKSLSKGQKMTEIIIHTGLRPLLCILGLMACTMFLLSVYRKKVKDLSYHLSIIIAISDAVYLLLMLEDRIMYSLAIITDVWHESMYSNVQGVLDNMANCALLQGTVTLCLHSIEGTFLIFSPIRYRQTWTNTRRMTLALLLNSACIVFFLSCEITHVTAGKRGKQLLYPIKNAIENGLFSIVPICLMICCYISIIIGYRRHQSTLATLTSTTDNRAVKMVTRLLIMTGAVYFTLGVPVDISKIVLVYSSEQGAVNFQIWTVKVIQSTAETLYGAALLSIFLFHKLISDKRNHSCRKEALQRAFTDDQDPAVKTKYIQKEQTLRNIIKTKYSCA